MSLRVLTLSDLHFGLKSWGTFGEEKVAKALKEAEAACPDVLLFGGDLANRAEEPDPLRNLRYGLEKISSIPAKHRIFVCGNNDLECLSRPVSEYIRELNSIVGPYGFGLLDKGSYRIGNVVFLGGIGWYNGTLWKPSEGYQTPGLSTREQVQKAAEEYWYEDEFKGRTNRTPDGFFRWVQDLMEANMSIVRKEDRVVLCTHFAPSPDFVLYGDSPKYDYLNWFQGSDQTRPGTLYHDPRVVMGFCGHTHRSDSHRVGATTVHNISGPDQPRWFSV